MAHFAHYIRRTIVEADYENPAAPYFALHQTEDQGFERPKYHAVPGATGLARHVGRGDCLWLFSELAGPWGRLPPSLDALVVVRQVRTVGRSLVFDAGAGSKWFALYDASVLLQGPPWLSSHEGPVACLGGVHRRVGQALRLLRRVADPQALRDHAARVEQAPRVFVSYRLLDGTRPAFDVVMHELQVGHAVFWDRWSLPRRLAERREFVAHAALDRCIRRHIAASQRVIGVCTPLYAEDGSYSRAEWAAACRQRKFEAIVPDDA